MDLGGFLARGFPLFIKDAFFLQGFILNSNFLLFVLLCDFDVFLMYLFFLFGACFKGVWLKLSGSEAPVMYGQTPVRHWVVHRQGLGRLRHIDTNLLWIQDVAAQRAIEFSKIFGTENPADLMTKFLGWQSAETNCHRLQREFQEGEQRQHPI